MSNYPYTLPVYGPIRGRGAHNPTFSPYPVPRGRGRGASGGRGRGGYGVGRGFGNVHLVNSSGAVPNPASVPSAEPQNTGAFTASPATAIVPDLSSSPPPTDETSQDLYPRPNHSAHSPQPPRAMNRQIQINNVLFNLDVNGSKLTRVTRECPLKTTLTLKKRLLTAYSTK
jgi:hypothetical protein